MKKNIIFMMLILLTSSCAKKESGPIVWKLGHIYAEDNILHMIALKFAEEIEKNTDSALKIQVYPNSLEGNEVDNINGIRLQTSDMTITGESLQTWAPKATMLAVPYTFQNIDHVKRAVDGEIGKEISEEIQEKVGLKTLFYALRLPRNLTSNRPIKTPSDLQKMILRVPAVPLFVKAWEALGAKPTPMALNEVFTSLQQGTIEGQENPLDLIHSSGFYEVQKYINLTEHVYSWLYFVVGVKQFEKLSPEIQDAVLLSAQTAQSFGLEELQKISTKYTKDLKNKGMEFVEVDKQAFQDIVKPAMVSSFSADQNDLYNKILSIQ